MNKHSHTIIPSTLRSGSYYVYENVDRWEGEFRFLIYFEMEKWACTGTQQDRLSAFLDVIRQYERSHKDTI